MNDLKEIIDEYAEELGWIEDKFYIWVRWCWIDDFLIALRDAYGSEVFDIEGIKSYVQDIYICIELSNTYICIEDFYPKDKYQH